MRKLKKFKKYLKQLISPYLSRFKTYSYKNLINYLYNLLEIVKTKSSNYIAKKLDDYDYVSFKEPLRKFILSLAFTSLVFTFLIFAVFKQGFDPWLGIGLAIILAYVEYYTGMYGNYQTRLKRGR